jgi:cardiolipin synthase
MKPVSIRVLTVPNLITAARLALVPVFVWAFLTGRDPLAFVILAVIAGSDWLDGAVARRLGQISALGKVLDPVADRIAIGAVVAAMAVRRVVPLPLVGVILAREIAVSLVFVALEARGVRRVEVNRVGKAATACLFAGAAFIGFSLLGPQPGAELGKQVGLLLLVAGAALSWLAAVFYVREVRFRLRESR